MSAKHGLAAMMGLGLAAVVSGCAASAEDAAPPEAERPAPTALSTGGGVITYCDPPAQADRTVNIYTNTSQFFAPIQHDQPYYDARSPAGYEKLNCLGEFVVALENWNLAQLATYKGGWEVGVVGLWPAGTTCAQQHLPWKAWGLDQAGVWHVLANDDGSIGSCGPGAVGQVNFKYVGAGANPGQYQKFWVQAAAYVDVPTKTYVPVSITGGVMQGL